MDLTSIITMIKAMLLMLLCICISDSHSLEGERGGSVVECRTPEREVGGSNRRRVVSLSKTLYSPKVLVNYPGSGGSVPT